MLVQTPQAFIAKHLMLAYDKLGNRSFTDDASAVCHLTGAKLNVIEGERDNIKITHPGDIEIAEIFIRRRR